MSVVNSARKSEDRMSSVFFMRRIDRSATSGLLDLSMNPFPRHSIERILARITNENSESSVHSTMTDVVHPAITFDVPLRKLSLWCTSLDAFSLQQLARGISRSSVEYLNIGMNRLGDYAVIDMLSTFTMSPFQTLNCLVLSRNGLTDLSADSIAAFLSGSNCNIKQLDVRDNHFSDKLAALLAQIVEKQARKVSASKSATPSSASAIAPQVLECLNLSKNSVSGKGIAVLAKAIEGSAVFFCDVSGNLAMDDALLHFQQILARNQASLRNAGRRHHSVDASGSLTESPIRSSSHQLHRSDVSMSVPRVPLLAFSSRETPPRCTPAINSHSSLNSAAAASTRYASKFFGPADSTVEVETELTLSSVPEASISSPCFPATNTSGAMHHSSPYEVSSTSPPSFDASGISIVHHSSMESDLKRREEQIIRVVEKRAERYIAEYAAIAEALKTKLEESEQRFRELQLRNQQSLLSESKAFERRFAESVLSIRQEAEAYISSVKTDYESRLKHAEWKLADCKGGEEALGRISELESQLKQLQEENSLLTATLTASRNRVAELEGVSDAERVQSFQREEQFLAEAHRLRSKIDECSVIRKELGAKLSDAEDRLTLFLRSQAELEARAKALAESLSKEQELRMQDCEWIETVEEHCDLLTRQNTELGSHVDSLTQSLDHQSRSLVLKEEDLSAARNRLCETEARCAQLEDESGTRIDELTASIRSEQRARGELEAQYVELRTKYNAEESRRLAMANEIRLYSMRLMQLAPSLRELDPSIAISVLPGLADADVDVDVDFVLSQGTIGTILGRYMAFIENLMTMLHAQLKQNQRDNHDDARRIADVLLQRNEESMRIYEGKS
eukprot:ANDGO_07946.mRNA.1 hypothetical protein